MLRGMNIAKNTVKEGKHEEWRAYYDYIMNMR